MKQRGCGREKAVEDSVERIVDRFHVGHSAVFVDLEILYVTRRAANAVEHAEAVLRGGGLLAGSRLEVVEQVELHMVDHGGVQLVGVRQGVRRRRRFYFVRGSAQDHSRWSDDRLT